MPLSLLVPADSRIVAAVAIVLLSLFYSFVFECLLPLFCLSSPFCVPTCQQFPTMNRPDITVAADWA